MMLIVVHRSETTTSNKISGDSDMLSHLISLGFHAEQKAGNVMESWSQRMVRESRSDDSSSRM